MESINVIFPTNTQPLDVQFEESTVELHVPVKEYYVRKRDNYEGPYEVTPSIEPITLETNGKIMTDDVKVLKVPCHRVPNETEDGTTLYIACDCERSN